MNILKSGIYNIKQAVYELKENKENIEKINLKTINSKINEISKIVNNDNSSKYKDLRKKIVSILDDMNSALDKFENQHQIKKIRTAVDELHSFTQPRSLKTIPLNVEKEPIKIKWGFISDLDARDHNGGMAFSVIKFMNSHVPFITSRSVLTAQGINLIGDGLDRFDMGLVLKSSLLDHRKDWEIYQSPDNEELLVFLPTSLLPDMPDEDKLRALDLKFDGSLKKISVDEALQNSKGTYTIDSYFNLFVDKPQGNKLFYIVGHGDSDTVGGLSEKNYTKFLNFLDQQKCRGLTVKSCYSGGESSLLNLPAQPQADQDVVAKFNEKLTEHTFSTVVRSIGDFPTTSSKAEDNIDRYFDELAVFLESSVETTASKFREMLNKIEGDLPKNPTSRVQVHFAQTGDAPGGFRSIGEQGLGFPLTYTKLKAKKLEGDLFKQKPEKQILPLEINQPFLDIHPLIIDVPIKFFAHDAILLSMVPGKSQHFLQSIELDTVDPLKFMYNTLDFHSKADVNVSKSYFIGTLKSHEKTFEEVIMQITPKGSQCVYRHEGQYYLSNGETNQVITPLQHHLFFKETVFLTFPNEAAVRASSGGQESTDMFLEIVNSTQFWSYEDPLVGEFQKIRHEENSEKLLSFATRNELTLKDKHNLCFHLLLCDQEDLALEVFKRNQLDPNIKNDNESPILCQALMGGYFKFAEYLLENGAHVNIPNNEGVSPLQLAIASGNAKLAELLISHPFIDLQAESKSGLPPLFYTIPDHPKLYQMLTSKGCSIDHCNKQGKTLLSLCIHYKFDKKVEFLLHEKVDPNIGNPSALNEAILANNINLVEKLLEKGGKPFEKDHSGSIPFIEALFQGNELMVNKFLERTDLDLTVIDGKGIHPLAAALLSGNQQIVQALINKNNQFPEVIPQRSLIIFHSYVEKCAMLGLKEPLQRLLKMKLPSNKIVEKLIVRNVMKHDIDMMTALIRDNYISPRMLNPTLVQNAINDPENKPKLSELFSVCLEKGLNFLEAIQLGLDYSTVVSSRIEKTSPLSEEELEDILSIIVEHNDASLCKEFLLKLQPDLNSKLKESGLTVFQKIVEMQDKELIMYCLEQGADINSRTDNGALVIFAIVAMGDSELIHLCFQKGATLETLLDQEVAISCAVMSGRVDIVDLLLANGCKMSEESFFNANLPLHAFERGSLHLLAKILQMANEFKINLNNMDENDKEELYAEVLKSEPNIAKDITDMLLKSGIPPILDKENRKNK